MLSQFALPLQLPHLALQEGEFAPEYREEPLFLLPPEEVFNRLKSIDWSFAKDETGFLTHDLHPYPAKFIPQIPGTLIALLSACGELVIDPFGGSGTTALEAIRLGRRALSVDANPLSALIGRAKTTLIDKNEIRELHGLQAVLAAELVSQPDPENLILQYKCFAPEIPNREKWFADTAFGELCLINARIQRLESEVIRDIAFLALSRIAVRVSFQDSETRYKSVPRYVLAGETLKRYLRELQSVVRAVSESEPVLRYGVSRFLCEDTLALDRNVVPDECSDFVVTSPPYGNATDYHLYHRFRLMWLGHDPAQLGRIEIGSHLRHQREGNGFERYYADLRQATRTIWRILRPGRYAALVLGESLYEGKAYDPASRLAAEASDLGFDAQTIIDRPIHATKRSFVHAGRRATTERILVLRRTPRLHDVELFPAPYRLWPYENRLRLREADFHCGAHVIEPAANIHIAADVQRLHRLRRLVFTHGLSIDGNAREPTWQATVENGLAPAAGSRKDPKYVTHGLHPYKGKFYPQLAKALLNLAELGDGAVVLDPFCGSGTTLLECYLNGYTAFGCDMHPLAAKIARGKTEVLEANPDLVTETLATVLETLSSPPRRFPASLSEFDPECGEEIARWFAQTVTHKLNWVLGVIRKNSSGCVRDFLEIVLSSIVREVSQQEPSDLRIRYRRELLTDADVLQLFMRQLEIQYRRIEKFWRTRGWAASRFFRPRAIEGDSRKPETYHRMGLDDRSVDLVLTSPPYATALPYIDTDRLSLLVLFGLSSSKRRPLEEELIGSREITGSGRKRIEGCDAEHARISHTSFAVAKQMSDLLSKDITAGFRKRNMPALLGRYVIGMDMVFQNLSRVCKPLAETIFVVGDNRCELARTEVRIPTTNIISEIAKKNGFTEFERINISVTTENMLHQKHAITENVALRLRRSG